MYRNIMEQRYSDNETSRRDVPSFIEPRPPLIHNPFMRPKPQKGTNLLELFEEDSEIEEPELVQVYLRMKPCKEPNNIYEVRSDRSLVTSLDTTTAGHGRRTQHNVSKMYTFSRIFGPECTQKEIFEEVVKENLKKLPDGHNFTLLTYGASGSGKTYTLMGTVGAPGLVPRSLEYVFKLVDAAQQPLYRPAEGGAEKLSYAEQEYELQWVKRLRHVSAPLRDKYRRMSTQLQRDLTTSTVDLTNKTKYYVWVSFVEIYNEAIYDLLSPPEKRTKLRIREDTSGNVYVKGATQAFVRSGEEAYDVMVAGKHNLVVAATGVHAHSSRSHCIFTITMVTETEGTGRWASVRLCDLAGSERARATRNTGARMQESRAINASLHVLERCLHTLRRKQRCRKDALVPYRESKLTRLLGSGLSGCRGEAVSMVVTLNPAPEYAHETKHVLGLAAVAQDIQINNTMLTTTFETSSQDTTIESSAEVMRLRTENERLHFELIQAHARNKELMSSMEAHQQQTAQTMRELVEEAKDFTRQFYEEQIRTLRAQMNEMAEEYESNLEKLAAPPTVGTPSRILQNKITDLMTEIAVLEEKLTAEQLARARAEQEVEHLRTCIDERDEKAFKDSASVSNEDLSNIEGELDSEEETDPFNESLEPVFKRDNLSRSQIMKENIIHEKSIDQSIHEENRQSNHEESINESNREESINESNHENSTETLRNEKEDSLYTTNDTNKNDTINFEDSIKSVQDLSKDSVVIDASKVKNNESKLPIDKSDNEVKITKKFDRGTYFVSDKDSNTKENDNTSNISIVENQTLETEKKEDIEFKVPKEALVTKIIRSLKSKGSDNSLMQFERLEMAAKNCDEVNNDAEEFAPKIFKEKRTYFDDVDQKMEEDEKQNSDKNYFDDQKDALPNNDVLEEPKRTYFETNNPDTETDIKINKEKKTYFDNIDVKVELTNKKINDLLRQDERSPSIVKEDFTEDLNRPSTIKKLLGKTINKATDSIISSHKKKHDSVDIFEFDSPITKTDTVKKSIENINLEPKIEEELKETKSNKEIPKIATTVTKEDTIKADNTIEEFENIYKDISASRATEFELLVSQNVSNATISEIDKNTEDVKYNLRKKDKKEKNVEFINEKTKDIEDLEKSDTKTKRRLRRRKNDDEVTTKDTEKLKDIVNLQSEFSDVTLNVPAPVKDNKDIPSPEKEVEENVPPLGIQSCPSKSVTRSRRKLFTPRAEPLEESLGLAGDSSERVCVPRPSYHRPRARRKL